MSAVTEAPPARREVAVARLPRWWPLAALTALAAVLRFSTLGIQSFWYDEAFTPLHVLHPSLIATLEALPRTENSPPLWYLLEWFDYRLLGTGEYALRLPSAIAGTALVPVAWAIGRQLADRAAAIACAALIAVGPLFVWYSQEARVYGLFMLTSGLATLAFVRVLREPSGRRYAVFAIAGALCLLSHYFGVFILAGMAAWLLVDRRTRRGSLPALAVLVLVGLALLPLISAQGARGTQWIGKWALTSRIEEIPGYYLTGYSGAHLGHSIAVLVALPLLAAVALGLSRMLARPAAAPPAAGGDADLLARRRRAVWITLAVTAAGVLIPLVMALAGADYLAPRNLVGAMVPFSALVAVLATWPAPRDALAPALLAVALLALLAVTVTVDFDPKVQRGNWRGVAHSLPRGIQRAMVVNQLGSAPLRYYMPGLKPLPSGSSVRTREIVLAGEEPLRESAGRSPAPGFKLVKKIDFSGVVAYRFVAPRPEVVSARRLRARNITLLHADVLAPESIRTAR
ncbi:MAG TPA: glycosyltransferase family 39 protein [Solirubrobacteraceae bacterium]|nr:glycosyltransferase family 39 protein [Solirubrobacteraceae bacterium]